MALACLHYDVVVNYLLTEGFFFFSRETQSQKRTGMTVHGNKSGFFISLPSVVGGYTVNELKEARKIKNCVTV